MFYKIFTWTKLHLWICFIWKHIVFNKLWYKNNQTWSFSYTRFTWTKIIQIPDLDSYLDCYLDRDPEVVPVYTGHSSFNTTKRITLFFIVQTMLHRNPDNIGIKVI